MAGGAADGCAEVGKGLARLRPWKLPVPPSVRLESLDSLLLPTALDPARKSSSLLLAPLLLLALRRSLLWCSEEEFSNRYWSERITASEAATLRTPAVGGKIDRQMAVS